MILQKHYYKGVNRMKKIIIGVIVYLLFFGTALAVSDDDLEKIAYGHSYASHASEFNVKTKEKWLAKIRETVKNPTKSKTRGNKKFYWQRSTGMLVIYNPYDKDKGTAFKATLKYFKEQ